jgi:hypothetical protein
LLFRKRQLHTTLSSTVIHLPLFNTLSICTGRIQLIQNYMR